MGKNSSPHSAQFPCLCFDTFDVVWIVEHDVHKDGTRHHGVHVLAQRFGLLPRANAKAPKNLGAALGNRVDKIQCALVYGRLSAGNARAEGRINVGELFTY